MTEAKPLDEAEFDRLMEPLGPFERRPRLAVAVSGGADSLALTLLAARWAQTRRGSLLALTVDHALRPDSSEEAGRVGAWLAAKRIPHAILRWSGTKPARGVQAEARAARYALLLRRCREEGIAHLLLGHHRDDQAETVLLRLGRGSGVDGLAGMAPVVATLGARLLRPLLPVPRERIEATLRAMGQEWVEDPSNRNAEFRRTRLRALLPALADAGIGAVRIADTAARMARAREALEREAEALLAGAASLFPAGWARIEPGALRDAPPEIALRALARLVRTVSGEPYPPRLDGLEGLLAALRSGPPTRRSLGGCLVGPRGGALIVCREPAAIAPPLELAGPGALRWDGRFLLRLAGKGRGMLGALGPEGWSALRRRIDPPDLPPLATHGLPAIFDARGPAEVPHLAYRRAGSHAPRVVSVRFAPTVPLTGGLVWNDDGTMC